MLLSAAPSNYALAAGLGLAVAALLMLPGLAWNALANTHRRLRSAFIPLPGLLYLAGCGVVIWITHPHLAVVPFRLLLPECAAAAVVLWRVCFRRDGRRLLSEQGAGVFLVWAALALSAAAAGVNPLPVAQEYQEGSALPGRIVASPPDHIIPYQTAAYFMRGFDGREKRREYFGDDWSAASRGPLVPLAVTSLLSTFRMTPSDGPDLAAHTWPVTHEGAFLARALGWLTNAMVVLGVGHLLTVLKAPPATLRVGLAWTALAPGIFLNTLFLWPKLFAGYFVLLALAAVIEEGWALAGLWMALAWLSHPVGLLFLPGLGLMLLWRTAPRGARAVSRAAARAVGALIAAMTPWLLYKTWLGGHDIFLDYLLADGNVPQRAASLVSWLEARWDNIRLTLVPFDFYFSDTMGAWLKGPLSAPQRWAVQYAKSLPAELGFFLCAATCIMALRPAQKLRRDLSHRELLWCAIVVPFAVMVVAWGYSRDGFGRNCLEPLVPVVIALTVATLRPARELWILALVGVWAENCWVNVMSAAGADGFRWDTVTAASWATWIIPAALGVALISWTLQAFPRRGAATTFVPALE